MRGVLKSVGGIIPQEEMRGRPRREGGKKLGGLERARGQVRDFHEGQDRQPWQGSP